MPWPQRPHAVREDRPVLRLRLLDVPAQMQDVRGAVPYGQGQQMLFAEYGPPGLVHLPELLLRRREPALVLEQVGQVVPDRERAGVAGAEGVHAVRQDRAVLGLGPVGTAQPGRTALPEG